MDHLFSTCKRRRKRTALSLSENHQSCEVLGYKIIPDRDSCEAENLSVTEIKNSWQVTDIVSRDEKNANPAQKCQKTGKVPDINTALL